MNGEKRKLLGPNGDASYLVGDIHTGRKAYEDGDIPGSK